ncbi:hypothetical protein TSMEX_007747 [Taenia solium]|eukprot:TsM_000117400 transcript=TsM_000117400 gene=TsM_000117400
MPKASLSKEEYLKRYLSHPKGKRHKLDETPLHQTASVIRLPMVMLLNAITYVGLKDSWIRNAICKTDSALGTSKYCSLAVPAIVT